MGREHALDINKDEKQLRTAAIGLGSFGIITELQFKMVPEMLVVTESHYWTLSQMKYHLINRPSDWISFEHYWWPFGSVSLADAFQCVITGTLANYDYQEDKVYCRIVRHYRNPENHEMFQSIRKQTKSYHTGIRTPKRIFILTNTISTIRTLYWIMSFHITCKKYCYG